MRTSIFILFFNITCIFSYGQNLNGIYSWSGEIKGPNSDYGIIEINIETDTTYTQIDMVGYKDDIKNKEEKWKKAVREGKIRPEGMYGNYYVLSEKDNKSEPYLVKIRRNKLIIYEMKKMKNGKNKKVRTVILEKKPVGNSG